MFSQPFSVDQEVILEWLGDKMIEALVSAVAATKDDLERYRSELPDLATSHSPRGLANVIHDWLWNNLRHRIDGMNVVKIKDSGPRRELLVGDHILIRLKRQSATGSVATYQTPLALDFYKQDGQLLLFDVPPKVKLAFGYRWDSATREIVSTIVSYPRSIKKSWWVHEIPLPATDRSEPLPTEPPSPNVIPGEEGPESMAG